MPDNAGRPAPVPDVRKGQGDVSLTREEFTRRLGERFYDPAFDRVRAEIGRVIDVAWDGYHEYRKSPRTRKAGPGFAEPEHELRWPARWSRRPAVSSATSSTSAC